MGAVLVEVHDDWASSERRYLSEQSMAAIDQHPETTVPTEPELPAA